jgi:plasmid stabilization system protein ParE
MPQTEIRDYLASQGGNRLARYALQEITAGFRLLASHPEAGHVRQDLTPVPIKFWPVFSYLVVYDPAARPLAIVRVPHAWLASTSNWGDQMRFGAPVVSSLLSGDRTKPGT